VRTGLDRAILELRQEEQSMSLPSWAALVPDHGKLMHLFLIREPDLGVFAHLHPIRPDARTFALELPALPAGGYQLYGDVTFENGISQTVNGTLTQVDANYIKVATTIAGRSGEKIIFRADITGMKTTGDGAPAAKAPAPASGAASGSAPGAASGAASGAAPGASGAAATPASGSAAAAAPGVPTKGADGFLKAPKPGVFVLPLEGTVGIGLRYQEMEAIAKEADKYGPGQIIVMLIESPGGLVIEGDKIHDSLREIKKRHRVVAWIREAISGAAFTALHCDEIYFMRVGSLGAITMFAGQTAISGAELQDWLRKCTEVAEMGGRNGAVVRAMIHHPLLCSYDKDPVTGKVTIYDTLEGKYVLSDEKDNLVLNASNALDCGFSDGTADTPEELAQLLHLPEWYEISDYGRKLHRDWQAAVKGCKTEVPKIIARLDFKNMTGAPEKVLGTRISLLNELKTWWDRCENVMMYEIGAPPKEQLDRYIRDIQKQIADIKKARRDATRG